MSKPVVVLGGGGHGRVLLEMLKQLDVEVLGVVDPGLEVGSDCRGIRVLGGDEVVLAFSPEQLLLVNAIGSLPRDKGLRQSLYLQFQRQGYFFKTLQHPSALLAEDVSLADGVQIMAGSIVQTGAKIAENTIVNTGAIVDHDCVIGAHAHLAPGVVLSGGVTVGDQVHIGTGAIVIQGINIGDGSVIGAGCVVTKDVGVRQIVYPARSYIQDL